MKRKIKSKLILCIIIVNLALTGIIFNEFSVKHLDDSQNAKNDVISDLRGTSGDWNPQITKSVGDNPESVFIGDANNDGYNDIATANLGSDDVSIILWNSTSGDWDPQITKSVGAFPMSVFMGDANNDGYNDIATANPGSDDVSIILWNSTSGDWDPQITKSVGDYPRSVYMGDANNDGYNDIATANAGTDDVSIILWNSTSGDWDPHITKSVISPPVSVFIGDANNDGYNDIATALMSSDDVSILLWNSISGGWDTQIIKSVNDNPRSVFIGDANNDGYNDIATANEYSDDVSILLWNSISGDWDTQIIKSVGVYPLSVFMGDANNDGYNDIATANYIDDNISIFLWNSTSGDWDSQITKSVGNGPHSVFIGDANNDGYNDIATANGNSDDVSILLWNPPPIITINTPENRTYIEPMSGYYLASYGFENDMDGSDPMQWIIDESGGTVQVINSHSEHAKIIEIHETSDAFTGMSNIFGNRTSGTVEWWVMVNRNDDWFGCGVYYGDTTDGVHIAFSNDGNIKYNNGSDWLTIMSYSANTWYHFRVEWDCTTDWHLWINETSQDGGAGYAFRNSPAAVDRVRLRTSNAGDHLDQYMYVDAVGYSWDPNYNIGDNLNEGLLLSFNHNFDLDWVGYSLDGQLNRTILGNTTIPFPEDGIHTIQVFGNDSLGMMTHSNLRYFSVDTSNPIVTITSPSSGDFFGSEAPDFEISIDDLTTNTTWYNLNNGINNTFEGFTGKINQTLWNEQGEDLIIIRFYANDSGSLEGYSEVSVYKDLTPPTSFISFIPYKESNIVNESTTFTITADDGSGSGVSIRQYKINNSGWIPYTGPFDLSSYSLGYYLISYQAIDNVGNVEIENTLLVELEKIPSKKSEVIPGYNLIFLISIICVVLIVLIKKRWKLLHK